MATHEIAPLLYGTDVNKKTSLFEYGVLVAPYTKDGNKDEYFVLYSIGNDQFNCGYKQAYELDNLLKGEDWADSDDIKHFLSFYDTTIDEWLKNDFSFKIQDCIGYWGYEEIMGTTNHAIITMDEVKEKYL